MGGKAESNVTGKFGLWVRNQAGYWLVDFCEVNNLTIINTCFKQLTTGHMDITREPIRNQIDYVIGTRRWRSHHKVLISNMKVKLKNNFKRFVVPKYNINSIPDGFKFHTVKLNWLSTGKTVD